MTICSKNIHKQYEFRQLELLMEQVFLMQIVTLTGEAFLLHLRRCSPLAVDHFHEKA